MSCKTVCTSCVVGERYFIVFGCISVSSLLDGSEARFDSNIGSRGATVTFLRRCSCRRRCKYVV